MSGETLPSTLVRELVLRALREDLAHQDVTTDALFDQSISARATVVSEEPDDLVLLSLVALLHARLAGRDTGT